MSDLTVIMLTLNKLPSKWVEFHKKTLLDSIGDTPLITISKEPMDWGTNLIQEEEGYSNIYKQILRGAKLATTKYIAIAEDDTLYPKDHFELRPPDDAFGYNMNRWGLFTWGYSTYFWKHRIANSTLIAPRELLIEALEERFAKYPNGMPEHRVGELGREIIEKMLGVTIRKSVEMYSHYPVVCMNHDYSLDRLERSHRKAMWYLKAYDIPRWGHAKELVKLWH